MEPRSNPAGRRPFAASQCHRCRFNRYVLSGKGSLFLQCTARAQRYQPQPQTRCAIAEPAPILRLGDARVVWVAPLPAGPVTWRVTAPTTLSGPRLDAPRQIAPGGAFLATATGLRWTAEPCRGPLLGWWIEGPLDWPLDAHVELDPRP